MSSANWWPFCLTLNVLTYQYRTAAIDLHLDEAIYQAVHADGVSGIRDPAVGL